MRELLYRLATDKINNPAVFILKAFLLFLSFCYGGVVQIILWSYKLNIFKKHVLPRPVVSIGNMTLGGAGKTPVTALIAQFLKENKITPVILTRGYMAGGSNESDEVRLLSESLSGVAVVVGQNRYKKGVEAMEKYRPDIFILDDGFQHWRLGRNLEVVLIDATNPFGNYRLIPRGILREPLSSLARANIFILTKINLGKDNVALIRKQLTKINPGALIVEAIHQPVSLLDLKGKNIIHNVSFLKDKKIAAVSAIGDPDSFTKTLTQLGADVKRSFAFMDHYVYSPEDIKNVDEFCQNNGIAIILTTEKDAVKLGKFKDLVGNNISLLALKIKIEIVKGENEFFSRISNLSNR